MRFLFLTLLALLFTSLASSAPACECSASSHCGVLPRSSSPMFPDRIFQYSTPNDDVLWRDFDWTALTAIVFHEDWEFPNGISQEFYCKAHQNNVRLLMKISFDPFTGPSKRISRPSKASGLSVKSSGNSINQTIELLKESRLDGIFLNFPSFASLASSPSLNSRKLKKKSGENQGAAVAAASLAELSLQWVFDLKHRLQEENPNYFLYSMVSHNGQGENPQEEISSSSSAPAIKREKKNTKNKKLLEISSSSSSVKAWDFPWIEIAKLVDKIVLKSYDLPMNQDSSVAATTTSSASSSSPLCSASAGTNFQAIEKGLHSYLMNGIPPENIILLTSWYGKAYKCQEREENSIGFKRKLSYRECSISCHPKESTMEFPYSAIVSLHQKGLLNGTVSSLNSDEASGTFWFNWISPLSSDRLQFWFSPPSSIESLVRLAERYQLGGVGAFSVDGLNRLAQPVETQQMWEAIKVYTIEEDYESMWREE